jgi:hypothetical protein
MIGLILSLTVLISLSLTAIPAIIICLIGLFKPRQRTLPCIGLLITLISLFSLMIIFITFLPHNMTPAFLNTYKFKRALECDFWLSYDKEHLIDIQSHNTYLFSKFGALHFKSVPHTYDKDDVIKYAEKNGWKYHLSIMLTKEDFEKYDKKIYLDSERGNERDIYTMMAISRLEPSPILLKNDCNVLAFETGNVHGIASHIMISQDGSEMVVFYWNPRLPDGGSEFHLPGGFKELNEIQLGNKQ